MTLVLKENGGAIENSPTSKPAKRKQAKEEVTGLIQQTFKSGYESPTAIAMADAYAAGVVLGIQERIAPLVTNAIATGLADDGYWTDAIATLPKSSTDCDWWETV